MTIDPQTVNAFKELLSNPSKYGFNFRPITECFKKSETVTAKHILAKEYADYLKKPLPKVIFYIIMHELFGQAIEKDVNGNLGYRLKLVIPQNK